MPTQQASLNTVQALLTEQGKTLAEQGRKLDGIKADFDRYREDMPDDYAPRRETDKAFIEMSARVNDHEARLRIIESTIPSAALNAYKDTASTREKALSDTTQQRFAIDERTMSMLWGALIMVVGYLVFHLLSLIPLH